MSDGAEHETLTMLEARLAAALDKIAKGLDARGDAAPALDDPGMTSGAFEDAETRAATAEAEAADAQARVSALEAQLAETQESLAAAEAEAKSADQSDDSAAAARDDLARQIKSLEAARQADRDEFNRTLAARDTAIATLKADLEAAKTAADAKPDLDDEDSLEAMRVRVKRLRQQRATARAERDEALDLVEELQDRGGTSDTRLTAMRAELVQLRTANADLLDTIDDLRTAAMADTGALDQAMVDEIAALRAARASEAAELERILADLDTSRGPSRGPSHGKEKTDA